MSLDRYPTMEIMESERRAAASAQLARIEAAVSRIEAASLVRKDELESALSDVVHHWAEFGPADGFDGVIDRAGKVLRGGK